MGSQLWNAIAVFVGLGLVILGVSYGTTTCVTVSSGSEIVKHSCVSNLSDQFASFTLLVFGSGLLLFGFRRKVVGLWRRLLALV